jgi:transcriptional regulator with XRE-family HTH domain
MRDAHQEAAGARIAKLREQQGWSQRALAKWVGLDQSAVSRIEAGSRRLSADELQRFAHAFHVSADDLLRAAGPTASPPPPSAVRESRAGSHFSRLAMTMPPLPESADSSAGRADLREATVEEPGSQGEVALDRLDFSAPAPMARMAAPGGPAPDEDVMLRRAVTEDALFLDVEEQAAAGRDLPSVPGLPEAVAGVARDWFALRRLAEAPGPAQRWSTGHSAEGKPERIAHTSAALRPGAHAGDVLYDRVARFWRSELHVEPDDGPLPDLVPLLEDGYGAQVIVARVARPGAAQVAGATARRDAISAERPVAAAFSAGGVPFIFVNAARPVVLQRFALAHAFAHHVLGHGDVVDHSIEWSRNVPPEAAANDFTEEFLAPVRAVQRWYERRDAPRYVRVEDLLELANAFGISVWSALFRSRAAGRLHGKQFHVLRSELRRNEWALLPRQAFLGGLRDTLSHLTPDEALPRGESGGPAVLRVPASMRAWVLPVVQEGRLSLEEAAGLLRTDTAALARQLARLGLE